MKSKYLQVSFDYKTGPPKQPRSKEEELKFFVDLEKWKSSDLLCLMMSMNCLKREEIML